MACDGRFQNHIVVWIGSNRPPKKVQTMETCLGTEGVDYLIDFQFCESELCAITFEY